MTAHDATVQKDKFDLMEEAADAVLAGDVEKVKALNRLIILTPEGALKTARMIGKERLLATELNLSAANAAFGEDWLDEYAEDL